MHTQQLCMALATFPDKAHAQNCIDIVLNKRLAACAQMLDIYSQYIWKEERCQRDEVLVLFKTRKELYVALECCIRDNHPYEVPEIIALDIEKSLQAYGVWICEVTETAT